MSTEIQSISDQVKRLKGHMPRILEELESVKDKPRIVIVLTHSFLEDLLNALCKNYLIHYKNFQRLNFSEKLYLLVEVGRISEARAKTIDWVRSKRNKVAHSALFVLDNSHMPEWADANHKTAEKTFSLCVQILGCFWNEHVEVFRGVYLEP